MNFNRDDKKRWPVIAISNSLFGCSTFLTKIFFTTKVFFWKSFISWFRRLRLSIKYCQYFQKCSRSNLAYQKFNRKTKYSSKANYIFEINRTLSIRFNRLLQNARIYGCYASSSRISIRDYLFCTAVSRLNPPEI